jgi:hypothetical protein
MFMGETDDERVILILCEWTAGTFVYFSIERFLAGKNSTGTLLAILAILFAIVGVKWPAIKLKAQSPFPNFPSAVERIARQTLYRRFIYTALAIALLASVGTGLYRHYYPHSSPIQSSSPAQSVAPRSEPKPPEKTSVTSGVVKAPTRTKKIAEQQVRGAATTSRTVSPTVATPAVTPEDCKNSDSTFTNNIYRTGATPDMALCRSNIDNNLVLGEGKKLTISGRDNSITHNTVTGMDVDITKEAQRNVIDSNAFQGGALPSQAQLNPKVVDEHDVPLKGAEIYFISRNGLHSNKVVSDATGVAEIMALNGVVSVFCALDGFSGYYQKDYNPGTPLTIRLKKNPLGGSVIFADGTGYIPDLSGRLNPILDSEARTYLYAVNIAIDGGKAQPVTFVPNRPMILEDVDGHRVEITIISIIHSSSLIDYRRLR